MKLSWINIIALMFVLTFVQQNLASSILCLDFYNYSSPTAKILKQGSLFGQSIEQIRKLEDVKISQLVAELKAKKIDFELINHGDLFSSILIKPLGPHDLSQLAQNFLVTRENLKLLISPVLGILLKERFAAGYFGYKDLIFPSEVKETASRDLILLSDAIRTEHAMVINPDFVEKLKLGSPLLRHELDHAQIESERKKRGADERSTRGQYSKNFKGFSYHGELNLEEAFVWLGDLIDAAKGIKNSRPKFLSQANIDKLSTTDIPTTDAHRLAIIQFKGSMLADYGVSISEAARSFFTDRPTDIRFKEWKSQVWAIFSLKVPNIDGTTAELHLKLPLLTSKGLQDVDNIKVLEKSMYDLYQTGVAFNNFGQFAYGILETFKAGQDLFFYPPTIKYLQKIRDINDLKDRNGEALQIDEIMGNIQN